MAEFIKLEEINLKTSNEINEKWVQQVIAENPEILGLGELILKDKERCQESGGRLDLLLESTDDDPIRYEVEIQLGKTDESHIIRTIEYWDVERSRYPNYKHVAVIIAEDITHRFLNVIHLFNKSIPIIAIQMKAVKVGDKVSLIFTKVLNLCPLATDIDESDSAEKADRKYWENKSSIDVLKINDKLISYIQEVAPGYELNYLKHYIGLSKDNISNNFIHFKPKKQWVHMYARTEQTEVIDTMLQDLSLDINYKNQNSMYDITIDKSVVDKAGDLVKKLTELAYKKND